MSESKNPETFIKRAGTTPKGTNYEIFNIANSILQLVSDDAINDFHLSSNDKAFGDFDDIVIKTESASGSEIIAVQLKHSEKDLALQSLSSKTGDFSLQKYFKSYLHLKNTTQKFILLTNKKFDPSDDTCIKLDGEDFQVKVKKVRLSQKDAFKSSTKIDYCYKFFVFENPDDPSETENISEYKTFFQNFYLYAEQDKVDDLEKKIHQTFKEKFMAAENQVRNFLNLISKWYMDEGKKEKLNKEWMQRAIALQIFYPHIKPFTFEPSHTNKEKRKILQDAISKFDVTVFKITSYALLRRMWCDAKEELEDIKEINRLLRKYQLSADNVSDLNPKVSSILLWLMGKCPLVIKDDPNVHKAFELCQEEKFILLTDNEFRPNKKIFEDLSNLRAEIGEFQNLIKKFTYSLQGKHPVSLELLMEVEDILKLIKTDDLLEMIDGPWLIGDEKEYLPEPYIERRVFVSSIDFKYLEKMPENCSVIIDGVNNIEEISKKGNSHGAIDIDEYLKSDVTRRRIILSKNICDHQKFRLVCKKNRCVKKYHQFSLSKGSKHLKWVRSQGGVDDLENYKIVDSSIEERDLSSTQFDNNINIVVGDPGLGKTEFTKSFKNNGSPKYWNVTIYPGDVTTFCKKINRGPDCVKSFKDFLKEKFKNLQKRDADIFELFLNQNKVLFVWEALDEISEHHLHATVNMIWRFSKSNCVQWVTSRCHLRQFLERKFSVLSASLKPFDEEEQDAYIDQRLSEINLDVTMDEVKTKIRSTFLFVELKSLLGIPLQLFMITELIRQKRQTIISLFDDKFAVTDLYHYFIEEKLTAYFKTEFNLDLAIPKLAKIMRGPISEILKYHQKIALQHVFPDEILQQLNIDFDEPDEDMSFGLTNRTDNDVSRFNHISFAEYLSALYFSENIGLHKEFLKQVLFEQQYINFRFFFDLLLAKKSPPHVAALCKDLNRLQMYGDKISEYRDMGGRTVLHLLCLWGQKFPTFRVEKRGCCFSNLIIHAVSDVTPKTESQDYGDMIDYVKDKTKAFERDELLHMTPLEYAIKSNNITAKIKLLHKQSKLKITLEDRINFLYYSATFGFTEMFTLSARKNKKLIKKIKDLHKMNLLHVASENGRNDLIDLFVKHGCNVNSSNEFNGQTPLSCASQNGHLETVRLLIVNHSNVNSVDFCNRTPLSLAAEKGHLGIVDLLIKNGGDINGADNDRTPLSYAAEKGHFEMVEFLANNGGDFNRADCDGRTPLSFASGNGHYETVKLLIMKNGDNLHRVDEDGRTPLSYAALNGHFKTAKLLIEKNSDINHADKFDRTPLSYAAEKGRLEIVKLLVQSGADANRANNVGRTPLSFASEKGHFKIVELLLTKNGAFIDQADRTYDRSPLIYAAEQGHFETVALLIKNGGRVRCVDRYDRTPLSYAAAKGHFTTVELLITNGGDVDHADKRSGRTPLSYASEKGNLEIVELLIRKGGNVNRVDNDNRTPLSYATMNNHHEIVELLINHKGVVTCADSIDGPSPLSCVSEKVHFEDEEDGVTETDSDGWTPLPYADAKTHYEIAQLLKGNIPA